MSLFKIWTFITNQRDFFLVLRQSRLLKSIAWKSRVTINCNNMLSILQKTLDVRTALMVTHQLDTDLNPVLKPIQSLFHHILTKNLWWLFRFLLLCRAQGEPAVKAPWKTYWKAFSELKQAHLGTFLGKRQYKHCSMCTIQLSCYFCYNTDRNIHSLVGN